MVFLRMLDSRLSLGMSLRNRRSVPVEAISLPARRLPRRSRLAARSDSHFLEKALRCRRVSLDASVARCYDVYSEERLQAVFLLERINKHALR